jgi:hypothetical protein
LEGNPPKIQEKSFSDCVASSPSSKFSTSHHKLNFLSIQLEVGSIDQGWFIPYNLSRNQVSQADSGGVTGFSEFFKNFQIPSRTQATSQVPDRVEVSPLVPPAGVPVSLFPK